MQLGDKPAAGHVRPRAPHLTRRTFVASGLAAPFLARSAQAADTLNAYSIWPENYARPMMQAFEKASGIPVKFLRFSSGEALARVMAEKNNPQVDVLFGRLATSADDPAFRFVVHSHHVQLHMRIAESAGSRRLTLMIERNHVLILNWLFDVAGRRTALPAGFHTRLAEALVSGDPEQADAAMRAHVRYGLVEVTGRISALAGSEWRERRDPKKRTG